MLSQNQCQVPSCQQQWCPQQPMENYTLGPQGYWSACATWAPIPWKYPQKVWLDSLFLPTKYHWLSTQPGLLKTQVIKHQKDGSWRPWTSEVSQNGLNQSRNRLGSCCSNGNTCLHTVNCIWENCSDQTQNTTNRSNTLQRVLPVHTPSHVWQYQGPYPGNAGYQCYPQITQSLG